MLDIDPDIQSYLSELPIKGLCKAIRDKITSFLISQNITIFLSKTNYPPLYQSIRKQALLSGYILNHETLICWTMPCPDKNQEVSHERRNL